MSKFIGIGAAGNKAVTALIEGKVISRESALLLNTTLRDIPHEYKDRAIKFGNNRGGCGKERNLSKELFSYSLSSSELNVLDEILDQDDDTVFIIHSTEGGTGCGSAPLLAQYYKEIHEINVHIIAFAGFEEDIRGMYNTVEYFQELSGDYTIQVISNKKFLGEANGDKLKAHDLANNELVRRMKIILGQTLVDSDQIIDDTDLYKVTTTPGLLTVEYSTINRNVKNKEGFNKILSDMIDETKSIDVIDPGCKRLAIILNISENTRGIIDYDFDILKSKLGIPVEVYQHIQNEGSVEFVNVIASGMRMPLDEVRDILRKYENALSNVGGKDDFFDKLKGFKVSELDSFNTGKEPKIKDIGDKKKSFLKSIGTTNSEINHDDLHVVMDKKKEDPINKY